MSETKQTVGEQIMGYLHAKGRKTRQAGKATTEEIATAIGVPVKQVYDRCYWLATRDGVLTGSGKGKGKVWRTAKKARKAPAKAEKTAPETAEPTSEG